MIKKFKNMVKIENKMTLSHLQFHTKPTKVACKLDIPN